MSEVLYGIGIAGLFFGPLLLYVWWKNKVVLSEIKDTTLTNILNITETGPIEISGTVHAKTTHQSPIGKEPSVLSSWFIEEWDETGKHGHWAPIAQGIESEPFEVEDETGTVTINLKDEIHESGKWLGLFRKPNFNPLHNSQHGVAVGPFASIFKKFPQILRHEPEEEPPEIQEFIDSLETINQSNDSITNKVDYANPHGERRYSENNIQDGDYIYLLANATSEKNGRISADDVTITNREDGPTIVSNMPEQKLINKLEGRTRRYSLLGIVLTVSGTVSLTLAYIF